MRILTLDTQTVQSETTERVHILFTFYYVFDISFFAANKSI